MKLFAVSRLRLRLKAMQDEGMKIVLEPGIPSARPEQQQKQDQRWAAEEGGSVD